MIACKNEHWMNCDKVLIDEMKILLIEDDAEIAAVVARGLRGAGYVVDVCTNGSQGLERGRNQPYGVVVLDLMLPGIDGMTLCAELRAAGITTPVLMLTAKDTVRDKVSGLEVGADDYLVKPFAFEELLARVKSLIRRDKVHRGKIVKIGYLTLDVQGCSVWVNDEIVSLKPREYALLEALVLNEGRVLSRDTIQDRIWGNEESFSNVVEVHIQRLRAKIDRPGEPSLIHTVRGLGYAVRRPDAE